MTSQGERGGPEDPKDPRDWRGGRERCPPPFCVGHVGRKGSPSMRKQEKYSVEDDVYYIVSALLSIAKYVKFLDDSD